MLVSALIDVKVPIV